MGFRSRYVEPQDLMVLRQQIGEAACGDGLTVEGWRKAPHDEERGKEAHAAVASTV